jgi:hypothetical protein
MIIFVETLSRGRNYYPVKRSDDLEPLFQDYPGARWAYMGKPTVDEGVQAVVEFLNQYQYIHSWVEGAAMSQDPGFGLQSATGVASSDVLYKSLRAKAASIGLALAALAPIKATPMHNPAPKHYKSNDSFGKNHVDKFLWNIMQSESTGGANVNHQPVAHGPYKGQRAIGRWALLKPTVDDVVKRMAHKGIAGPQHKSLAHMNRDQIATTFAQSPDLELDIARNLATHVLHRQKGNEHMAAYAWLNGHNLHHEDIAASGYKNHPYVQKYAMNNNLNPLNKKSKKLAMIKNEQSIGFAAPLNEWVKYRKDKSRKETSYPTTEDVTTNDERAISEAEDNANKPLPKDPIKHLKEKFKRDKDKK